MNNQRILNESQALDNAFHSEVGQFGKDPNYDVYHARLADSYRYISNEYHSIIGYTGSSSEELVSFTTSLTLTQEQKKALHDLRKEPIFIKVMGEMALKEKSELETVLGSKINNSGKTFADEHGAVVACKTEEQLNGEWEKHNTQLSQLLENKTITDEQYDSFSGQLDSIYNYYESCSRGEQIPFRKLTNEQFDEVASEAQNNGISFEEQFREETMNLKLEHDELQDLQAEAVEDNGQV